MMDLVREQDLYLDEFTPLHSLLPGADVPWLREARSAAIERFGELGFPTTKHEEWKYTNVAPIAKRSFKPARLGNRSPRSSELYELSFAGLKGTQLVFVNGHYSDTLSSFGALPREVSAGSLSAAIHRDPSVLEPYLSRHARCQDSVFTALNTAFMSEGAFVYIPKGMVQEEPIHLLFISFPEQEAAVTHPRNLIVLEPGSQATIIETYAGSDTGLNGQTYLTNAVTEIVAGESSFLEHLKVQRETDQAFHIGTIYAHQGRGSTLKSHSFSVGGSLVRSDIEVVLDDEGAECSLNGLFVGDGNQHVDHHTSIEHAKPHCSSRQLYKGILNGVSTGVFNGKVKVQPDAQKSNALQTNNNLLLSEKATINTKPQLEIYADDVKCAHGATIGQLDEEGLFYMRSRGIDAVSARNLMIYAFASEMAECVKVYPLQCYLNNVLHRQVS